jgi:Na+/H+ antiporter NhaC
LQVEFSLFSGIFVGACIVFGNIKDGFTNTIENYILNALADSGHGYVYLFTFFLSGLVAMLERSGGMIAFTKAVSKYATTARSGQAAAFLVGVVVFFDDYANTLLAGQSMRPLLDSLFVSREKLAFFVDATAAPIASISPVSSWVGFEVGLIQSELDRIIELVGSEDIGIKTSGFAVFLESIKYRYYPILMLVLIMILIFSQRDFGPMLIAERKTELYKRTDGGEGSVSGTGAAMGDENQPPADQALHSWNMLFPITLLVRTTVECNLLIEATPVSHMNSFVSFRSS